MKKISISLFSTAVLLSLVFPISVSAVEIVSSSTTEEVSASSVEESSTSDSFVDLTGVEEKTKSTQNTEKTVTQSSTNEAEQVTSTENDVELEKALAAGYTKEQYEAIMQMPILQDEEIKPNMTRATLSEKQAKVVSKVKEQLGKPYVWGAKGPNSFDCSGLVQYVFQQAVGMSILAPTTTQEKQGTEVSLNSLQAGDLLFYGPRGATTHVGIYIGNGQMIHAPRPGQNVQTISIQYYMPNFARRILKGDSAPNPESYPNTIGMNQNEKYVWRLYHEGIGRHIYTSDLGEANALKDNGWNYEGVCWVAPSSGTSVYRVHNPSDNRHLYTPHQSEIDFLKKNGWNREGVAFYAGGTKDVYRLFNPNAKGGAKGTSHLYTMNPAERDSLVRLGWNNEGVAFKGVRTYK